MKKFIALSSILIGTCLILANTNSVSIAKTPQELEQEANKLKAQATAKDNKTVAQERPKKEFHGSGPIAHPDYAAEFSKPLK